MRKVFVEQPRLHQFHIFKNCQILSNCEQNPLLQFIFGDIMKQEEAIDVFLPLDKKRKYLKENIIPGENARTRATIAPNISA